MNALRYFAGTWMAFDVTPSDSRKNRALITIGDRGKNMSHTLCSAWTALTLGFACVVGCGSAPSDEFFRCVYATSSGGGEMDVVLYSPKVNIPSGTTVRNRPSGQAVKVVVYQSGGSAPVSYAGTWTGSQGAASYTATASDGSTVQGNVQASGSTTSGTLTDPQGNPQGTFGGADIQQGQVATYCGTYTGSASGSWNFVVSTSGAVSGAFDGSASGPLSGSAAGTSVSLNWSAQGFFGPVAGTATGDIAMSTVSGSWSSSDGQLSGSWSSTSDCAGPSPAMIPTSQPSSCDNPCTLSPSGGCCGVVCCGVES